MKAYGHTRKDKQECKYGCCTGKSGKMKSCRTVVDRANRKSARQKNDKECNFIPENEHIELENNYE